MTLNEYAAKQRLAIFERLRAGLPPESGDFDPAVLKEGQVKGAPQMGATRYEPESLTFEFIYPDPKSSATVLSVRMAAPERIVFLPVPEWVVESIWQGEIHGSYVFESDARRAMAALAEDLTPEANVRWFGPQAAKRRE